MDIILQNEEGSLVMRKLVYLMLCLGIQAGIVGCTSSPESGFPPTVASADTPIPAADTPALAGTPAVGPPGYVSVNGTMPFAPSAAGVTISVDGVEIVQSDLPPAPGYVVVLVGVRIINNSRLPVWTNCTLVDDFSNQYAAWSPSLFGVQPLPVEVEPGQTGAGFVAYHVPESALPDKLRLRWEPDWHKARIEIFLPPDAMVRQGP